MSWTPVTKPTVSGWNSVNPAGRTQYDQPDVTYDQADMYYDGVNPNSWSNITKPSSTSWNNIAKPV